MWGKRLVVNIIVITSQEKFMIEGKETMNKTYEISLSGKTFLAWLPCYDTLLRIRLEFLLY